MKCPKRILVSIAGCLFIANVSYAQFDAPIQANKIPVTINFTDSNAVTFAVSNLTKTQQFLCYAPPPMNGKPPAGISITASSEDAKLVFIGAANGKIVTSRSDAMIIQVSPLQQNSIAHIKFTVQNNNINLQDSNLSITCSGHTL